MRGAWISWPGLPEEEKDDKKACPETTHDDPAMRNTGTPSVEEWVAVDWGRGRSMDRLEERCELRGKSSIA